MGRQAVGALRDRAGSRRGWSGGSPVLQTPVLGAAGSERRHCPGVRGVLLQVPETPMNAAVARQSIAQPDPIEKCRYARPESGGYAIGSARRMAGVGRSRSLHGDDCCRHRGRYRHTDPADCGWDSHAELHSRAPGALHRRTATLARAPLTVKAAATIQGP